MPLFIYLFYFILFIYLFLTYFTTKINITVGQSIFLQVIQSEVVYRSLHPITNTSMLRSEVQNNRERFYLEVLLLFPVRIRCMYRNPKLNGRDRHIYI